MNAPNGVPAEAKAQKRPDIHRVAALRGPQQTQQPKLVQARRRGALSMKHQAPRAGARQSLHQRQPHKVRRPVASRRPCRADRIASRQPASGQQRPKRLDQPRIFRLEPRRRRPRRSGRHRVYGRKTEHSGRSRAARVLSLRSRRPFCAQHLSLLSPLRRSAALAPRR